MEKQTLKYSEMLPDNTAFVDGEFEMDGNFVLLRTRSASVGDLHQHDLIMDSDFGKAKVTMLGREHYLANWSSYSFRCGLAYSARVAHPVVELHFQLQGPAPSVRGSVDMDINILPGENNLVFMPAIDGSFELTNDSDGSVFEVMLSEAYFVGLAERYPHLFEAHLDRTTRGEVSWLSRQHLRTTPRMWGIIQRIRQHETDYAAGSLFLEAQILELLFLQFEQLQQPVPRNGNTLSRSDVDRIYEARDVLLAHMEDPPTLAELARRIGTNECKLKRGFREVFGTSPYAYLLEHKLELARVYLLDTEMTVAEVAYRVGYRDPAHLTNAFRKQYGIRPSDLR